MGRFGLNGTVIDILNRYKNLTLQTMKSWGYSGAELADIVMSVVPHNQPIGVLFLGEPGSGKTTLALQMADKLKRSGWDMPAVLDDPSYTRFCEEDEFGVLRSRRLASECRCLRTPYIICRDMNRGAVDRRVETNLHVTHFSSEIYFVDFAWTIRRDAREIGSVEIRQIKDRYRSILSPPISVRLRRLWACHNPSNDPFLRKGRKILRYLS